MILNTYQFYISNTLQCECRSYLFVPALFLSRSDTKVPQPKSLSCAKKLKTIGGHIRDRRINNNRFQPDAA